jgi:hypothetical protein
MISRSIQLNPAKSSGKVNLADKEQAMFPLRFNVLAKSFIE